MAPPALPAYAQGPVITVWSHSLYFCWLFGETSDDKGFSKSGVLLRIMQENCRRCSPLISYYMKVLSIANAGKGAGPFLIMQQRLLKKLNRIGGVQGSDTTGAEKKFESR
jgi:hypothetical protein